MLHIRKVLGAKPKEHVEAQLMTLLTPWGEALDPAHVLEEHPTPQFARASFRTLNGVWSCAFMPGSHAPTDDLAHVVAAAAIPGRERLDREIVVPFSPEAPLSGVGRKLQPSELLWYRRLFDAPAHKPGERILLHFQAVDFACAVRVNGVLAGTHAGGYAPFSLDITDSLADGENELLVCVADPGELGGHLRGKQRFDRGDIWYTAQSGIWQTVWLEVVPAVYLASAVIEPDADQGVLAVGVTVSEQSFAGPFEVKVVQDGAVVASCSGVVADGTGALALRVSDVRLWSPEDPRLYTLVLTCADDAVESYCAFRTVEARADAGGRKRVFLNGRQLFIKGVLDQAYWSDGLMTAPSDEALAYDIEAMRKAGFNLMRKHIKIEADRWYYHCDRLGMLVLQDMVSGGDAQIKSWHWSYKPTLFKFSWSHYRDDIASHWENLGAGDAGYRAEWVEACRETVETLRNHPSIIGWSLFNEGWGQFCARQACALVRALDPTRLVDAVSGWYDQGCGDFHSVHNYFRDMAVWHDRRWGRDGGLRLGKVVERLLGRKGQPEDARAFFISEFGGYTHRVEGHSSLDEAYGYEPYDDREEWRVAVRDLLAEIEALEPKGLAGYVYTQVSDIEEETNGILTYDRRVNKLADL